MTYQTSPNLEHTHKYLSLFLFRFLFLTCEFPACAPDAPASLLAPPDAPAPAPAPSRREDGLTFCAIQTVVKSEEEGKGKGRVTISLSLLSTKQIKVALLSLPRSEGPQGQNKAGARKKKVRREVRGEAFTPFAGREEEELLFKKKKRKRKETAAVGGGASRGLGSQMCRPERGFELGSNQQKKSTRPTRP